MTKMEIVFVPQGLWECAVRQVNENHFYETDHCLYRVDCLFKNLNIQIHFCDFGFAACREGMFGRNCQESCKAENGCQGLSFCLTDPYGCSCASGWHGDRCRKREFNIEITLYNNCCLHVSSGPCKKDSVLH